MTEVVALREQAGREPHLELLRRLGGAPPGQGKQLEPVRHAARTRFEALGFPPARAEGWRYTPLAPLLKVPFGAPTLFELPLSLRAELAGLGEGAALILVNGRFSPELSRLEPLGEGVFAGGLGDAIRRGDEAVGAHLGRHASFQEHAFVALNTALVNDGALVVLGAGAVASGPIHLIYLSTAPGAPTASQPRTLIVAEEGSRASVVESYLGLGGVSLTNAVTEVVLCGGAQVDHLAIVREGDEAFHLGSLQATVSSGAVFASTVLTLSGARVRRELQVLLAEEGAQTRLNGLYLARGEQHVDNHTFVDHAAPGCTSQENYRGIVGGHATAVFDGRVLVRAGAQKSNANLTNKNLLLSDDATVDAKPMLEIFADDVKATHGAAVGRLDEASLFYLRSRGVGEAQARELLTLAFARDVLEPLAMPSFTGPLDRLVSSALARLGEGR
ncbi:MAG: Fe-S cluster assembly protein SufD [Myxococcaceae bacterium]